jgi:hypothetical protein
MRVNHPKGEFDPYTFNHFQHMLKAWEKRGSQICISVPQMSVTTEEQKLTNPDAPSLTRQQHEEEFVSAQLALLGDFATRYKFSP